MNNEINLFDEQEIKLAIKGLLTEKERYQQEKLARKIGSMKDERTAEFVAELLYSKDVYVRNISIELFIALNEKALPVLKEKLLDKDRNIRKFVLDALKYINGEQSSKIALGALDDDDENVVEAALEVISHHQYKEAEDKLKEILRKTNSVWIINELVSTFASLEMVNCLGDIEQKIFSSNVTDIERNILVNTYVRTLGRIGSYLDIDVIINKYAKDFVIDDSNLVLTLSTLISKTEISKLSELNVNDIEMILKENFDYNDSDQLLICIAALVKLQLNFFLDNMEEIYKFNKQEELFTETLYNLVEKLQDIPRDFVYRILVCKELELVFMGLKLIYKKQMKGYNSIVEELCNSRDKDISMLAIRIITDVESYKNTVLIERMSDFHEEAALAIVEIIVITEIGAIERLILKLHHKSRKVRKAAVKKIVPLLGDVNIKSIEEIISSTTAEEGIEALEVLFRIDESIGWNHIRFRMDNMNESVRAGLVDIVQWSKNEVFYDFMDRMINDPSQMVRKKAVKVLNSRINDRSLYLLKKMYESENDSVNKMQIISNLYRFNSDKVFNIINDAAFSHDTLIRIAAVKALSFIDSDDSISVLKIMINDQVEEVADEAKEALCKKEVLK